MAVTARSPSGWAGSTTLVGKLPRYAIAVGAVVAAATAGAVTVAHPAAGIGLVLALCYVPLVLIDLPLGIALWVILTFVAPLPFVGIAPNAAAVLVGVAWLAGLGRNGGHVRAVLYGQRRLAATTLLLVTWLVVSLAWAERPDAGAGEAIGWIVVALVLLVVASAPVQVRDVRLLAGAFVAGGALSVVIGLAGPALSPAATEIVTTEGRLQGASGDPNLLAAGLVPAIALAGGLLATARTASSRWLAVAAVPVLLAGLVQSVSRGGLVAAGVAAVAAIVVLRGHRTRVAVAVGVLASCLALYVVGSPAALQRIGSTADDGNGRTELWSVAWRMADEHGPVGVGLGNFTVQSPRYVREPGSLRYVELIADRPHVAHNAYLQLLAENGAIGLGLFLAVVAGCVLAAAAAGRRFADAGDRDLALMARVLVVAMVGMLASAMFISLELDRRLWIVLALGPALLALARRRGASRGERPA